MKVFVSKCLFVANLVGAIHRLFFRLSNLPACLLYVRYGLKIGVILSVIVGLTATRPLVDKKIEFYRESGSGYDVNAYFLAMNIVTTVEHSIQLVLVAAAAYWMRDGISARGSYFASFLMLAWLTVSWALMLAGVGAVGLLRRRRAEVAL